MNTPIAIVTPCHQVPLSITTRTEGHAYMTYEVPDEVYCNASGCYNTWNADGTVSYWPVERR